VRNIGRKADFPEYGGAIRNLSKRSIDQCAARQNPFNEENGWVEKECPLLLI